MHGCFFTHFPSKSQLSGFFIHGTFKHWLELSQKQSGFRYIKHLSVIAQNQICIGFLCMSCLENESHQLQYHSHLSMFYCLHLPYIYFYHLRTLQKYKEMLLKIVFLHIAGKTLIVIPPFSHWNSYLNL